MRNRLLVVVAALGLMLPAAANAQSVVRGVREGAAVGHRIAGPIGAGVGSVLGGSAYAVRSGASAVLGVPEETSGVTRHHTLRKKRTHHH
jgi:hypothetical protein